MKLGSTALYGGQVKKKTVQCYFWKVIDEKLNANCTFYRLKLDCTSTCASPSCSQVKLLEVVIIKKNAVEIYWIMVKLKKTGFY